MPRLILSIAAGGQAILVGRGAGYYLPRETSLHVRIVAPLADRVAHMADLLRLTREQAAEQVRQSGTNGGPSSCSSILAGAARTRTTSTWCSTPGCLNEETCADVIVAALNGKQDALDGDSRLG